MARPVADGTRIGTGGNSGLPGGRAIRRGQCTYSMRARFEGRHGDDWEDAAIGWLPGT